MVFDFFLRVSKCYLNVFPKVFNLFLRARSLCC
jgi:hypothetical protein